MLRWTARLGAVTAEALAQHEDRTLASARARLLGGRARWPAGSHSGCSRGSRRCTRSRAGGLRASGAAWLRAVPRERVERTARDRVRASRRSARARLSRSPGLGERELRRDERDSGAALASARLGDAAPGRRRASGAPARTWCCWPEAWPRDAAAGGGRGGADRQGPAAAARDLSRLGALPLRRGHAVSRAPPTCSAHLRERSSVRMRGRADRGRAARLADRGLERPASASAREYRPRRMRSLPVGGSTI